MPKGFWWLLGVLSVLVGWYPIVYFIFENNFGIFNSKSTVLLTNTFWKTAFYGHIVFGGIALMIGWLQFSKTLRHNRLKLHNTIGKLYTIAVLISGVCGVYIGFFAFGGWPAKSGFITLGMIWIGTTILGYLSIRQTNIIQHKQFFTYSYAACFAAVTLRVWLPLLILVTDDIVGRYQLVAWVSWVPNMGVAYLLIKNKEPISKIN